jgi:hypothetical protein
VELPANRPEELDGLVVAGRDLEQILRRGDRDRLEGDGVDAWLVHGALPI